MFSSVNFFKKTKWMGGRGREICHVPRNGVAFKFPIMCSSEVWGLPANVYLNCPGRDCDASTLIEKAVHSPSSLTSSKSFWSFFSSRT